MNNINIIKRELTAKEFKRMNVGFDELALEEDLEIQSSDRFSVVAMDGDTFVGCSSGLAYKNGEKYSGWFFLTDLFVEQAYRSKGLGARLLKTIEDQVTSLGIKHIWLWTSGDKALRFYRRYDYKQFAELETYYSDGSSRIGLRKDI